ncbi:MAG: insulinase family protein, partial [Hungatella sp.]
KEDMLLAKKLDVYKSQQSGKQLESLLAQTKALKNYQDTPSTQAELEQLPMLCREDIGKKAEHLCWKEHKLNGVQVLHHDMFTSGIGYLRVLFHTNCVPVEDLPYVGLLKSVLGYVDTEHYSYGDLTSEIYLNSGGINFSTTSYANLKEPDRFTGAFVADIKVLYEKLDFGFSILSEILLRSKLGDEKRLGEILYETKSRSRMKLENAGHSAAVARATSYFSATASFNDITGGIGYYHFLEDLVRDYEDQKQAVIAKLREVAGKLFTKDNMMISYTADQKGFAQVDTSMKKLTLELPQGNGIRYPYELVRNNLNEGFKTSSQVNYVARCGNFLEENYEYTGALKILKVILSYDYLWTNLRVKGGAYGCMSGFGRSGEGYFVSYRDPNLAETNQIYEKIVDYLKAFRIAERDMTKYVIGAISALDTPLPPSDRGARALSAYLSGVTDEMLQEEREQILNAEPEDICKLAGIVKAVLDTGSFCVVGNDEKIEANAGLFGEIKNLYHA